MAPGEVAVALRGVEKDYRGLRPLRIERLDLRVGESIALVGLDRAAAESLVNLITAATLPDRGDVEVFGLPTDRIADPDTWLRELDRFGILSERAVLLDQLTVEQNLALPLSLELDRMSADLRGRVRAVAEEVGLAADLERPINALGPGGRTRVRFGKALAAGPRVLLGEHPNAMLPPDEVGPFAAEFSAIVANRGLATLVLTADHTFARAVATRVLRHDPSTGALTPEPVWRRWLPWRGRRSPAG